MTPGGNKNSSLHWGYIGSSLTFLLISAYFDNVRGPLLPIIREQLQINYEQTSWFLVCGHLGGLFCMLLLLPLLNLWSEKKIGPLICLQALVSVASVFWLRDFPSMLLVGTSIGMSLALLGAMCNIFLMKAIPPETQGRALSGLHTMYGIGSFFAPFCVASSLKQNIPWRFLFVLPVPAIVLLGAYIHFRLKDTEETKAATRQPIRLSLVQILCVFAATIYVCAEVSTSMWMTAFIVDAKGLPIADASLYVSGFFLAMCLTRFACFLFSRPSNERFLSFSCLGLAFIFFCIGLMGYTWAFCLAGLCGPFYPLFFAKIRRVFPENWRSLTLWMFVAMQALQGAMHLFLGTMSKELGVQTAYFFPAATFALTIALLAMVDRLTAPTYRPNAAAEIAKQK